MPKRTLQMTPATSEEDIERLKASIIEQLESLYMKQVTADDRTIRFRTGPWKKGHPVTLLDSGLIELDLQAKTLTYRIRYWWQLSSLIPAWFFVYFAYFAVPGSGAFLVPLMAVATFVLTPLLIRFFNTGFARFVAEHAEKSNIRFETVPSRH